jgi:hypothetical protein
MCTEKTAVGLPKSLPFGVLKILLFGVPKSAVYYTFWYVICNTKVPVSVIHYVRLKYVECSVQKKRTFWYVICNKVNKVR